MNVLGRLVIVAGLGSLLLAACGSDDDSGGGGGDDRVALCKQTCEKIQSVCFGDAGSPGGCDTTCTNQQSDAGPGGSSCTNESEIVAAFKACLEKTTCQELLTCPTTLPPCRGGSGGG
jgi:hypothetical protein